jgi:Domain of Unknown Function (DUF1259)
MRSAVVLCLFLAACASTTKPVHRTDWKDVDAALGKSGTIQPDDVYKVSFPRSDLDVTVGDVHVRPALALGSWVAFIETGTTAMAMGDLVLTESEVNDVIAALRIGVIDQTALHNHLLGESPHVMYLHFSGHGDVVALARTLHAALARTRTPMVAPSGAPPSVDLPTADLDRIIGVSGKANGGVYQFSVPRSERIVDHGMVIPSSAGVATAINFEPTGSGRAAISGDFVLRADEVNPVIGALRDGGIAITALHSHMLTEEPRLFFMHFWANDDAVRLATTLRTALDRMRVPR